jgi:hypothetical protein
MIFALELTVPADTAEDAVVSRRDYMPPGVIKRVLWIMPTGCNDMVFARLYVNEAQIMPLLPDTWLKGNGMIGPFDEDIEIPAGGAHAQLKACSPGTTYEHVITVILNVVQPGAKMEDVVLAVKRLSAAPFATDEEISAEGESDRLNFFGR